MRTKFSIYILFAALFVGVPAVQAQEQGSIMDDAAMDENIGSDMMTGGMGTGGMGMGGRGRCMTDNGCCPGMMQGTGKGHDLLGFGPVWILDLNSDQRTKINRIRVELQKQLWSLKGKTIDEQALLSELYSADRPDAKKIGAVYKSLFDIRRQMIEAKIEARNRAREVLNKEQLQKLKQLQQNRMMEMNHGMMHPHGR